MDRPIGVFDSGLGGLTVVRALRRRLPEAPIVYFGDTARVPYGIKSPETVTRFAAEACGLLLRHEPRLIVAACNTASATALPALAERFAVPILGVIGPGAAEAVRLRRGRPIGVIATEATVASGAYERAIRRLDPEAPVVQKACPLLVPIVEEGRRPDDPIVRAVLAEYLAPLAEAGVGTLVLGCTHYPLLRPAIAEAMGPDVALVDSAEAVARRVAEMLGSPAESPPPRPRAGPAEAESRSGPPPPPPGGGGERSARPSGRLAFYVSDNPARFREVGGRFLGEPAEPVTQVIPEELTAGAAAWEGRR